MYVRPFNNWAVPAGLRLGAITWGEALRRPEAAARINECNESRTLCFYARLWVGFARRVADVASPQQAQSVAQSTQMQASQAQPSRSQPTRCCVVCLEEMEITMAAVPCGHCLCERCSLHVCSINSEAAGRRGIATCPMCRVCVQEFLRLYM